MDSRFADLIRGQGLRADRNLTALRWLRASLLDEHVVLLPQVLRQFECPACWTHLSPDVEVDFIGCPNCGHGMTEYEIEAPHRCVRCASVIDGPARARFHAAVDERGETGLPCDGEHVPAPYLDFDVVARAERVVALHAAPEDPAARKLGAALWPASTVLHGRFHLDSRYIDEAPTLIAALDGRIA